MIFGVIKKISSLVCVDTARDLNRLPSQGILPSIGVCETLTELVVWITPPITTVAPSLTSTWVVACWVDNSGFPLIKVAVACVFSTSTVKKIVLSAVIWGVTERRSSAAI